MFHMCNWFPDEAEHERWPGLSGLQSSWVCLRPCCISLLLILSLSLLPSYYIFLSEWFILQLSKEHVHRLADMLEAYPRHRQPCSETFYILASRGVCVSVCLCVQMRVCGTASSGGPESNWGPSEFCEAPGGRGDRDKDREPCHQNLSRSATLLVNLQSSESLQRCLSALKKYTKVGPSLSLPSTWWEHRH